LSAKAVTNSAFRLSNVFAAAFARTTGLPLYTGTAFRRPDLCFTIRAARVPIPETNDREAAQAWSRLVAVSHISASNSHLPKSVETLVVRHARSSASRASSFCSARA
jgi:hypothetical protein